MRLSISQPLPVFLKCDYNLVMNKIWENNHVVYSSEDEGETLST